MIPKYLIYCMLLYTDCIFPFDLLAILEVFHCIHCLTLRFRPKPIFEGIQRNLMTSFNWLRLFPYFGFAPLEFESIILQTRSR